MQRTDWWLPEGRGVGRLGEKGERIKKCKLAVTQQSRGCGYSIGNRVNNIVITRCGARWVLD